MTGPVNRAVGGSVYCFEMHARARHRQVQLFMAQLMQCLEP
jgi:hypothetical protein